MLADRSLTDLIEALASPHPTPGGGSAAAVAAAMGAALLAMVAALPKTRARSGDGAAGALSDAGETLVRLRRVLTQAVDADATAYDQVLLALERPKGTEAERADRRAAIERATRRATDAPLEVMRLAVLALAQGRIVAAHASPAAASDARVAIALLRAALAGSLANVEINVAHLSDAAYVDDVTRQCRRLWQEGSGAADEAERLLVL